MKKRGMSHIEVILASILFIGAVSFSLYFFNPPTGSHLREGSLEYTSNLIIENTSVPVYIYSIWINNSNNQITSNSKIVALDLSYPFSPIPDEINVKAQDFEGKEMPSEKSADNSLVYINWSLENGNLIYIMLSEDLEEKNEISESAMINENYYRISSNYKEKVMSKKKLIYLNGTYYNDYEGLKELFGLPSKINFGFSASFSDNDELNAERNIGSGIDVLAEESRMLFLHDNNMSFGNFGVKVW